MPGVTVSVDGVKVYEFQNTAPSTIQLKTTIQVDPPRSGRYVTVARPNKKILHFCEVQVLGMSLCILYWKILESALSRNVVVS